MDRDPPSHLSAPSSLEHDHVSYSEVMTIASPLSQRLAKALLLGAVIGSLFLGAGSRLVMRAFALASARSPAVSLRGTLTVVLAGAVAGALGSLILLVTERYLPASWWAEDWCSEPCVSPSQARAFVHRSRWYLHCLHRPSLDTAWRWSSPGDVSPEGQPLTNSAEGWRQRGRARDVVG